MKARHAAHNRYEIVLDDIETLVEQQESKEYVDPVEQLRTLRMQVEVLTREVKTLKEQMAQLLAERTIPLQFGSSPLHRWV